MNRLNQEITMIAAVEEDNGLGLDNKLVWYIPRDLKHFKDLTNGHCIIMGRKTFESLPKALPYRKNIVLSRRKNITYDDATVVNTVEKALEETKHDSKPYIVGGGEVYKLFMNYSSCIELTRIHHKFKSDTFFPKINLKKWGIVKRKDVRKSEIEKYNYSFITYKRKT
jgi:dihydrofolate reductase